MKHFNKLICFAVMPLMAFTTSCNSYGKSISFTDAYEIASKNYDKHELDYVDADYTLNVNALSLNGYTSKITATGDKVNHDYKHDFSKLKFEVKDLFAICITTEALSKIQYYYTTLFGASVEFLTGIGVEMNYYTKSGGLSIVANTKKDTIHNLTAIVQQVYSLASAINVIRPEIFISVPTIADILDRFTINPASTASGSFEVYAGTDSNGFINKAGIKTSINYDLGFGQYKVVKTKFSEEKEYVFQTYTQTKGALNIDISVSANFR